MDLSKEEIEEYKRIYKKVFGEEISNQEAYEQGCRLIRLIKLVTPKEEKTQEAQTNCKIE